MSLDLPGSLHCSDVHCSNPFHQQECDTFVLDILESIVKSTYSVLPTFGGHWAGAKRNTQGLPSWLNEVEPYRQQSRYWGAVWVKEGRPSTGWLHDIYCRKRAQYYYAVRKAKAKLNRIKAENLLGAALNGDTELLKEMKKIRNGGGRSADLPEIVDGANGEEEISEKFRSVYSALYNSASTKDEMDQLLKNVQQSISVGPLRKFLKLMDPLSKRLLVA